MKRNWYFFVLNFLPIIMFIACVISNTTGSANITAINEFFSNFQFTPVAEVEETLLVDYFGVTNFATCVTDYISYLVALVCLRIIYEIIVFLPRIAIDWTEKGVKRKW